MNEIVLHPTVRKLLGLSHQTSAKLHRDHELTKKGAHAYTVEELDRFLRKHAKNFKSVLTWAQLAARDVLLLEPRTVSDRFGLTNEDLKVLRASNKIAYLYLPGKKGAYRYEESSVARLVTSGKAAEILARRTYGRELDVNDVARLFGVPMLEVESWERRGLLAKPVLGHKHDSPYLCETCWITYIADHCSPTLGSTPGPAARAQKFVIARRPRDASPLLNPITLGARLDMSRQQVVRLAEAGELWGVINPEGHWRFAYSQVKGYNGRTKK